MHSFLPHWQPTPCNTPTMLLGKRLVRLATFTSKLLSQLPSLLLGTSSSHYTPEQRLVQAICQGKLYTAQELLSRRQPPDLTAAVICHQFWIPEPCSHLGFYSPVSPLAVAVSLTASEPEAVQLVQLLVQRGALPTLHDYFHDHTGRHTCLSKALQRGHYQLAQQLLWLGACPDIVASTNLLSSSGFSLSPVAWLIEHTVTAAGLVPSWLASTQLAAQVVQDCRLEGWRLRHFCTLAPLEKRRRRLERLHRCVTELLRRLSAAGMPPAHKLPGVTSFEDGDLGWGELEAAATQGILWGLSTHHLYPKAFRAAVQQLVLANGARGFVAGEAGQQQQLVELQGQQGRRPQEGGGSSSSSSSAGGSRVCLNEHLLVCIIRQLAGRAA